MDLLLNFRSFFSLYFSNYHIYRVFMWWAGETGGKMARNSRKASQGLKRVLSVYEHFLLLEKT